MTFPLDLVRDSVRSDVTGFLATIETQAQTLAELTLQLPAGRALEAIGVCCHGIAGTTALVGVQSLSSSARLLEHLADLGKELVVELELMTARTRDLGGLYLDGVTALRAMLEHELDGNSADATQLSTRLNERIEVASAGDLHPSAAPSRTRASSTPPAVRPAPRPPQPAESVIPDELGEIFREEARDALVTMRELARGLEAAPGAETAEPIERLFHTLKGAAATVGLREVAELARTLQLRLAAAVDGDEPIDDAFVADVIRDASWWFELAGVGGLERASAGEAPAAVFRRESARALAQLEAALSIGAADRDAIARALHQIKGSALVVGQAAVGAEATTLEDAARAGATLDALRGGLARLAALVSADAAPAPAPARAPVPAPAPAPRPIAPTAPRPALTSRPASAPALTPVTASRVAVAAVDPELWEAFQQECQELLDGIDHAVLELDGGGGRPTLAGLFRGYHTLKGSVNTIGLHAVGALIHDVEDAIEAQLEAGGEVPARALVEAMLEAQRLVKKGLGQAIHGYLELDRTRLDARLRAVAAAASGPVSVASLGADPASSSVAGELASSALAPSAGPDSAASVGEPVTGGGDLDARRYVRVPLERLDALMNLAGELVIGRSRLIERTGLLRGIQRELGVGRQRLVDTVDRFSTEHEFASLDGRRRAGGLGRSAQDLPRMPGPSLDAGAGPVAVGAGATAFSALELDHYDDIHILSRSLTELSTDFREMDSELVRELSSFHEDADRLGAIVSTLQTEITRARMIAVDALFARLRLPIRDAAEREGKEVLVVTSGEEVTLDKAIADSLFAPLLHLVRNAVGHGLEHRGARDAAGKPSIGTIRLAARQESGQIVVEVGDDGGGLDRAALRARGAALGLVAADAALDDPAITELVFAAGVSTAHTAGAVSGRGVGGNVVKRAIDRLGGAVRVESSPAGTTFTITLPMTLAITRAVIARSGDLQLAIPLSFTQRIRDAASVELVESAGLRRLVEGDGLVPVTSLARQLEQSVPTHPGAYVVVRIGDEALALEVDAVVGQEEIVVKPLGALLEGHPLFAGVTFRGTGDLALILDIPSLVETAGGRGGGARPRGEAFEPTTAVPDVGPEPVAAVVAAPSRLRVLFIDDSVSVRKVAERALVELGVEVVVAVDGVDGLDRLRAGHFDLVFTDLEMPRMHGFDLLREVRYVPAWAELPVVVVSSRSGSKHQDQARALGASDYITKPFTSESLGAMLTRWGRRG